MIKYSRLITLFIPLLTLSYCFECEDCDGIISEPTVSFTFIDFDSLTWVENNLTSLTDSLVYIDSIGEELFLISKYLEDSISILNDSIDNGGLLEAEQLLIISNINWTDSLILLNEENIEHYNFKIDEMMEIQTTLKNGSLGADTVFNLLNDQYQVLDSFTYQHKIALNYNDSLSFLGFSIASHRYFINLQHRNELVIDVRGNARISLSEIDTIPYSHNFASIIIQCENSSCKANETVFTCYY